MYQSALATLVFFGAFLKQEGVDNLYSIRKEALLVLITWIVFSQAILGVGIVGRNPLSLDFFGDSLLNRLSYNGQRLWALTLLSLRSMVVIFISTIKNIYDASRFDQLQLIPPDERDIEQLELALHEPIAVRYFYNFLDENQAMLRQKSNNFRMLALYMDIRCYDESLTKMILS